MEMRTKHSLNLLASKYDELDLKFADKGLQNSSLHGQVALGHEFANDIVLHLLESHGGS